MTFSHRPPRPIALVLCAVALVASLAGAEDPPSGAWLGADDRPLPLTGHDEVEEFLRSAAVVSVSPLRTGITGPRKLLLERDGIRAHAVFKTVDETRHGITRLRGLVLVDLRDSHLYDCAAYQLDRLLGLDRVPPSVPRQLKGEDGTVTLWIERTIMDRDRRERRLEPPDPVRWEQQKRIMYVFDNLIGNVDSNLGNILIDRGWRLWLIDHTRAFNSNRALLEPRALTRCERGLFRALEQLDEAEARRRLAPYLGRYEIDAVLARRTAILELLRAEIERVGENVVLFDLRPPTPDLADW